MNRIMLAAAGLGLSLAVAGCAVVPLTCCNVERPAVAAQVYPADFVAQKILATGYGAMGINTTQLTLGQQRLMAMRAARVDAYRNLAEQVYGFRVWGNTAVAAFSAQNDNVRTYVDAFMRGARLVNMTTTPDGNYEATVELDLSPAFFGCVSTRVTGATCSIPTGVGNDGWCTGTGCVQPSAYYFTN